MIAPLRGVSTNEFVLPALFIVPLLESLAARFSVVCVFASLLPKFAEENEHPSNEKISFCATV